MSLTESILKCHQMSEKLKKLKKVKPLEHKNDQLISKMFLEKQNKQTLKQIVPFYEDVSNKLKEYISDNRGPNEKLKEIENTYNRYIELVNDQSLRAAHLTAIQLKEEIQQIENEILQMKTKISVNFNDSVNLFERVSELEKHTEVPEMNSNLSKLNELIEEKYEFEIEGVSAKECEIIQEMADMLDTLQ